MRPDSPAWGPLTTYDCRHLSSDTQEGMSGLVAFFAMCRLCNGYPSAYLMGHSRKGDNCPVLWGRCVSWDEMKYVLWYESLDKDEAHALGRSYQRDENSRIYFSVCQVTCWIWHRVDAQLRLSCGYFSFPNNFGWMIFWFGVFLLGWLYFILF